MHPVAPADVIDHITRGQLYHVLDSVWRTGGDGGHLVMILLPVAVGSARCDRGLEVDGGFSDLKYLLRLLISNLAVPSHSLSNLNKRQIVNIDWTPTQGFREKC